MSASRGGLVVAHGVDLAEIARIERLWRVHGARFLDRVFTPREQQYCLDTKIAATRLAGRFAAKEAILKVLGTGWRGGIEWTHMEILPDALGAPLVALTGRTREIATERGISDILVSISHSGGFALGSAIGVARR